GLEGRRGQQPLPPRPVHVPLPLSALPAAAKFRRTQWRLFLCPPSAVEHAAASADDAERSRLSGVCPRAGFANRTRRRRYGRTAPGLRLPPLPEPEAK